MVPKGTKGRSLGNTNEGVEEEEGELGEEPEDVGGQRSEEEECYRNQDQSSRAW